MSRIIQALQIDIDKCTGRLSCMRACPTAAIRVREGKVAIDPLKCIDCGECIVACKSRAIMPRTDTWESVQAFPFKVAITSPTLFGQFPAAISPEDVVEGLKAIGFDAVYDLSIESELINMAIQDYLADYNGPLPLISSTCPVVVRLLQVSYPGMVDQIIPIEPPRELAGREMKKYFTEQLGIPHEDIGAIYITPCPAKMASIKEPAENVKSHLDLAIGINEIYNPLLSAITKLKRNQSAGETIIAGNKIKSKLFLSLALTGGQSHALRQTRYITISQLANIIRVFDDIEKGKIRDVEFLECYACTGGCIGGPLTVDDLFVARSKLRKYIDEIEESGLNVENEAQKRYIKGDYFMRRSINPRSMRDRNLSIREQIERVKIREKFVGILPGIDCGLCGAPTCEDFADDVAHGDAEASACVFISDERLKELRNIYGFY